MNTAPAGFLSHFDRWERVLALRREGKSYRQIADLCGLKDEKAAQRIISKAIGRVLKETAEEVRSIELSRLELLITTLWDKAITDVQGDKPDFRRFDRVKQLLEAKLKFCGAQSVLEDASNGKGNVQIFIKSFTANATQINNPAANTALQISDRSTDPEGMSRDDIESELALLVPDDDKPESYA